MPIMAVMIINWASIILYNQTLEKGKNIIEDVEFKERNRLFNFLPVNMASGVSAFSADSIFLYHFISCLYLFL